MDESERKCEPEKMVEILIKLLCIIDKNFQLFKTIEQVIKGSKKGRNIDVVVMTILVMIVDCNVDHD